MAKESKIRTNYDYQVVIGGYYMSESIDNIGNYPWGTLGIPLGYPWGNHIGNLVNLSIIIDT